MLPADTILFLICRKIDKLASLYHPYQAAEGAVKAMFNRRSPTLGLVGKHIDTSTGGWTETTSGIGYVLLA